MLLANKLIPPLITAFADNWGWHALQPLDHRVIFQITVSFVQATGMAIDWRKSWSCATKKQHGQMVKQALSRFLEPSVVKQMQGAFDLGFQITYHGPPKLGQKRNRFTKAMRKLLHSCEISCGCYRHPTDLLLWG